MSNHDRLKVTTIFAVNDKLGCVTRGAAKQAGQLA